MSSSMNTQRKHFVIGSVVLVCLVATASAAQAATRAGMTKVSFTSTFKGSYDCLGPCTVAPGASDKGTVQTSSSTIGTLTFVGAITEGVYDAHTNCLAQQETLAFKPQTARTGKDTFFIRTTDDKICFGKNPNVATETADFTIGGGTGRFAKATGSGHFSIQVLTSPPHDLGTMTAALSY
jgi:hypothetical protein